MTGPTWTRAAVLHLIVALAACATLAGCRSSDSSAPSPTSDAPTASPEERVPRAAPDDVAGALVRGAVASWTRPPAPQQATPAVIELGRPASMDTPVPLAMWDTGVLQDPRLPPVASRVLGPVTQIQIGARPYVSVDDVTRLRVVGGAGVVAWSPGAHAFDASGKRKPVSAIDAATFRFGNALTVNSLPARLDLAGPRRTVGVPFISTREGIVRQAVLDIDTGTVVVATTTGDLHAIDIETGLVRWWRRDAFRDEPGSDTLLLAGGRVMVHRRGETALRTYGLLDGSDGQPVVFDRPVHAAASVDGEGLVLGDNEGVVHQVEFDADGQVASSKALFRAHDLHVDALHLGDEPGRLVTCGLDAATMTTTARLWREDPVEMLGELPGVRCSAIAWGKDSTIFFGRGRRIERMNADTGEVERLERLDGTVRVAGLGEDAGAVLFDDGGFAAWRVRDGHIVVAFDGVGPHDKRVAFPDDASWLVWGDTDTPIQILSLPTGHAIGQLEDAPRGVDALAASGDGTTLASLVDDRLTVWDVDGLQRRFTTRVGTPGELAPRIVLAQDGTSALVVDGVGVLHDVRASGGAVPVVRTSGAVVGDVAPAMASDGSHVAWLDKDDALHVRPLAGGPSVKLVTRDVVVMRLEFVGSRWLIVGHDAGVLVYDLDGARTPAWSLEGCALLGADEALSRVLVVNDSDETRLDAHAIDDGKPLATGLGPDLDASLEAVTSHGRIMAANSDALLPGVLWVVDSSRLATVDLLGDGDLLFVAPPFEPPGPMRLGADGSALRAALGLAADHRAEGRIVEGTRGLELELDPDRTVVEVDRVRSKDTCRPTRDKHGGNVQVFDGEGRSAALIYAPLAVSLVSWDEAQQCLRARDVFTAPHGDTLVDESFATLERYDRVETLAPLSRRFLAELTPARPGFERIFVGELGLAITDAEGNELAAIPDGVLPPASFGWEEYVHENWGSAYEVLSADVSIVLTADGALMTTVELATHDGSDHGSRVNTETQVVRLELSGGGRDLIATPVETTTTSRGDSWTFTSEGDRESSEVERTLFGPGGTVTYESTYEHSTESDVCDADHADEDCCESTVTETRQEGSWTHSELGVLLEMPTVDETTEESDCD